MSDEPTNQPYEPSAGDEPTAEHEFPPPPPAAAEPVAEPPVAGQAVGTARPPASPFPSAVVAASRSRWLPPLATGLIGLMLGIVIGAVGLGVVVAVARHAHGGPGFRGDDRGQHLQKGRPYGPGAGPGQFTRPFRPGPSGPLKPFPSPQPS